MDIRDAAGHPIADLEEPDQWERQPLESSRSFSAFCVYRDMGEDRTLRETAVQLGSENPHSRLIRCDLVPSDRGITALTGMG